MKIITPYLFLILLFVCSCDKEDDISECNVENPIEELKWLADIANSLDGCQFKQTIFKARYNKGTVFFKLINDPLYDGVQTTVLWNCKGDTVKEYGPNSPVSVLEEVENREEIFTCKE